MSQTWWTAFGSKPQHRLPPLNVLPRGGTLESLSARATYFVPGTAANEGPFKGQVVTR